MTDGLTIDDWTVFSSVGSLPLAHEAHRARARLVEGAYADSDRCADFEDAPPTLERAVGTIESQGRPWVVRVQGFRRCGQTCPEAGGFVAVTDLPDEKVAGIEDVPRFLSFDGSATADLFDYWADDYLDGPPQPYPLECTPVAK
jgi:hypothetical protein